MKKTEAEAAFGFAAGELLGVPEARALLKLKTENAVQHRCCRGDLPFRKFGNRLYFLKSELLRCIESAPGVRVEEVLAKRRRGNGP